MLSSLFKVYTPAILCSLIKVKVYNGILRNSLIRVYTVCHSQHSDQRLHCLPFPAVWSGSTRFAIHSSLIKVKVHSDPQEQSDQGLHYLPFSAVWSWTKLFPIFSKQYYQGLHCLPFFLSSFINVYIVCHFQLSDHGLHYLSFSAVRSGSTLFPILSSLIKVNTVCHSQSDRELHFLPFSAGWLGSTLFSILSK